MKQFSGWEGETLPIADCQFPISYLVIATMPSNRQSAIGNRQ
jgi:hypothetical protein